MHECLTRRDSPLRHLRILNPDPTAHRTQLFLKAVTESKLERLDFGTRSAEQLGVLIEYIPAMKFTEMELHIDAPLLANTKTRLLQALSRNFRFLSMKVRDVSGHRNDMFDENDTQQLQGYLHRNERLDRWIKNPTSVPASLGPEALKLAVEAGETMLYQSLRHVLVSDNFAPAAQSNERKRKRPRYDESYSSKPVYT